MMGEEDFFHENSRRTVIATCLSPGLLLRIQKKKFKNIVLSDEITRNLLL